MSCPQVETCLFVVMFLYFFSPIYHNEFLQFVFPAGLTGYVAVLFLGWL
jgi:hypothetical protein